MRQSLAESADSDHLEPSATGHQSDSTLVGGSEDRRDIFCPSMNRQVAPQRNLFWACEQCQNEQNLRMDERLVRVIHRVDLENLDALMTPIGNDDETLVKTTKASIQREPQGSTRFDNDQIRKSRHWTEGQTGRDMLRFHGGFFGSWDIRVRVFWLARHSEDLATSCKVVHRKCCQDPCHTAVPEKSTMTN